MSVIRQRKLNSRGDRYLTSTVNIPLTNEIGSTSVPIGARYRKFRTEACVNQTHAVCRGTQNGPIP